MTFRIAPIWVIAVAVAWIAFGGWIDRVLDAAF